MSGPLDLPEIVSPRLRQQVLSREDAADLQCITNDPAILRAVHFLPEPFGLADAEALIAGHGDGQDRFFGGRLAGGELATVCGAHLQGENAIEIGYWVATVHQGGGLAFEAAEALVAALRRHLPRRRITAECRIENQASWRLLHKLGFRSTGEPGKRPGRSRLVA